MSLVDVVRVIAVFVGIAGTVIVAPKAFWLYARQAREAVRTARQMITRRTEVNLSDNAKSTEALSVTIVGATATANVGPGPGNTVDDRLDLLFRRTDQLRRDITAVSIDASSRADQLTQRIDAVDVAADNVAADVRGRLDAMEAATIKLNARGLPVIAAGIALGTLPDVLLRHDSVVWILLAITAAIVTATVMVLIRDGRVERRQRDTLDISRPPDAGR